MNSWPAGGTIELGEALEWLGEHRRSLQDYLEAPYRNEIKRKQLGEAQPPLMALHCLGARERL